MTYPSTLNCSGTMTDILLEGVRETIGIPEKSLLERSASVFDNYLNFDSRTQDEIFNLLEKAPLLYGERGSCGIAHRIGEASFRYFLRKNGKQYSLTENSYRLLNSQQRILFGLKQLAKFALQNCGACIEIHEDEIKWYWQVVANDSVPYWNRFYSHYIFGLLREFFTWTSGGRYYPMEEETSDPSSDIYFQIAINKKPLGN
ncbi:MAG: hypothetical protein CVU41_09135 [Chloroflexi bacterium HGW-Chloroflexi-3]|nr:MAG: hypothetical protein CVU41_09135 [Chloroflexi bacterium HGW-Chloroflexi-3]